MVKVVEVQLEKGRFENFHVVRVGNKFMELGGLHVKTRRGRGIRDWELWIRMRTRIRTNYTNKGTRIFMILMMTADLLLVL